MSQTTPPPDATLVLLKRIAEALDRLSPPVPAATDTTSADAFVWQAREVRLQPVAEVNRVGIGLLRGVDRVRDLLADNTERFARGLAANNVLL
jgi:predicted AAA+ superfamily ATPase